MTTTPGIVLYDPTAEPRHSSWPPTFGDGTRPVRRTIARRDGTPWRRVADVPDGPGGDRPLRPRRHWVD
jgi:hypothetical protein